MLVSFSAISCAELDATIDAGIEYDKPANIIIDENLRTYDVLKSYSNDLFLGTNASFGDISEDNTPMTLISSNFNQIRPNTEFLHQNIVEENGIYNFTTAGNFMNVAAENSLPIYGGEIISNKNLNSTFLNSIAAPITFLTPLFSNLLDKSDLERRNIDSWETIGNVSVVEYMGLNSVRLESGTVEAELGSVSITSSSVTVEEGANFQVTLYLLSSKPSEGKITLVGLNDNEPEMDWMGIGEVSPTFTTDYGWNKIQFNTSDFDDSGLFSFKLELGKTPNAYHCINITGLSIIDLNSVAENPDEIFVEAEDCDLSTNSYWEEREDDVASEGKYLYGNSPSDYTVPTNDEGDADYVFTKTINVNTAGTYTFWIRQKCDAPRGGDDSFFVSVNGSPLKFGWWANIGLDVWTWANMGTYELSAGDNTVKICIRENGKWMDKLYFTMTSNVPTGIGSVAIPQDEYTLEVSHDVKSAAIAAEMVNYISSLFSHLNRVAAWSVVGEPLADDGSIALGTGGSVAGEFYWADYLGGKYISEAFKVASDSVPAETMLFISERDLDTNTDKLASIKTILASNNTIDGLAIKLELSTKSDMDKVEQMFKSVAETGKMIAVLDLAVSVSDQSYEELLAQAEVYEMVASLYMSNIPTEQQYGILLSNPSDNTKGLWDSGYNRRPSYGGFIDGLSSGL